MKSNIQVGDKVSWNTVPGTVQTGTVMQLKKYPIESVFVKTSDNKDVWIGIKFIKKYS